MQTFAIWLQAISTMILASLTIWVVFYSDVGDLAVQLLQSELWETKQEMKAIYREKEELESQKKRLQNERIELSRQREEHVVHVVNGRLGDLWLFGVRSLDAYRTLAKSGQELVDKAEKVEMYRDWNESNQVEDIGEMWSFWLPDPEDIHNDRHTEWGDLLLYRPHWWECSIDYSYVYERSKDIKFDPKGSKPGTKQRVKRVTEWQQDVQVEYRRRLAEYHATCFDEWESAIRERIESVDGETALNIRDFSNRVLEWLGINNASKEVTDRIRSRLMNEISNNSQLANLTIQLQVAEGASLQEIAVEAERIENNVKIARDWLDEATKDRHLWQR